MTTQPIPVPTDSGTCPYCAAVLRKPEDRPFFALERDRWTGDGETIPMRLDQREFSIHRTRDDAAHEGRGWQQRGWVTTVSGPHWPERHCGKCVNW